MIIQVTYFTCQLKVVGFFLYSRVTLVDQTDLIFSLNHTVTTFTQTERISATIFCINNWKQGTQKTRSKVQGQFYM